MKFLFEKEFSRLETFVLLGGTLWVYATNTWWSAVIVILGWVIAIIFASLYQK